MYSRMYVINNVILYPDYIWLHLNTQFSCTRVSEINLLPIVFHPVDNIHLVSCINHREINLIFLDFSIQIKKKNITNKTCYYFRYKSVIINNVCLYYYREMALEASCQLIYVECTSHFSAKAVERLGFQCIYSLAYADYVNEQGEMVFKTNSPHRLAKVYVLPL